MNQIKKLENCILDKLFNRIDNDVFEDKIDAFKLINTVFHNETVDYLLGCIDNLKDIYNNEHSEYLRICKDFYKNKKYDEILDTLKITEILKMNKIYQYFINKIVIKIKLIKFNKTPFNDTIIEEYPERNNIENRLDLECDILNLEKFISKICCDNKKVTLDNINKKTKNYLYFFKLLKFEISILKETRDKFYNLFENLVIIINYFSSQ